MSDDIQTGAAADQQAPAAATFTVEKIYLKDVSFEAPNAPQVFTEQGQPDLQLNLNQKVQRLNESAFEVVLAVTLTCTMNGKTAYLAEVEQAGIFGLAGFEPQALDAMLGVHCPNLIFPYAAQAVSFLVQNGGFPPFQLQPVNFDALYAEGMRQRIEQFQAQQAQAGNGLADAETAGNA